MDLWFCGRTQQQAVNQVPSNAIFVILVNKVIKSVKLSAFLQEARIFDSVTQTVLMFFDRQVKRLTRILEVILQKIK